LAGADVLLLNERPEVAEMCVPSKLTSYYAAGRPVVAATNARSAAASEMSASGAGVRVEPDRPDELLAGVLAIAGDRPRAEAMGQRGVAYAREVLSDDAARAGYSSWVERLAADRVRGQLRPVDR
jgi:hypothetical protein